MSPLVTKAARNEANKLRRSDMTVSSKSWREKRKVGGKNASKKYGKFLATSTLLQRSRRPQDRLRFFVEERIAYGDRPVSQQRLAEEVLGEKADFSPTSNPHVRIYLRRLR
jgi:hypothetical protein